MTDSELREYATAHIERDIEANRALSGIDFSQFLAEYITICTSHQYLKPLDRENFRINMPLKITDAQIKLSEELKKPITFQESAKAGVAITNIFDREELDKLDAYAEGLVAKVDMRFFDANTSASQHFIRV